MLFNQDTNLLSKVTCQLAELWHCSEYAPGPFQNLFVSLAVLRQQMLILRLVCWPWRSIGDLLGFKLALDEAS